MPSPIGPDSDFGWSAGAMINPRPAPEAQWAGIAALAQLQLLDRIIEREPDASRRDRMRLARDQFAHPLEASSSDETGTSFALSFSTRPGHLREQIHKTLPEAMCLGMLIAAVMDSPFSPFAIKAGRDLHKDVLPEFARDLGVPGRWAEAAVTAAHTVAPELRLGLVPAWAMAVGGTVIALASVPLVFIFAPAGLAGGAVFLAGLAALGGPAGMLGGLSIVAGVAAVGGSTAVAGAFLAGSSKEVEARVKILEANALAKHALRPNSRLAELSVLDRLLTDVERDLAIHREIDDGRRSPPIKELERKAKAIKSTLDELRARMARTEQEN